MTIDWHTYLLDGTDLGPSTPEHLDACEEDETGDGEFLVDLNYPDLPVATEPSWSTKAAYTSVPGWESATEYHLRVKAEEG